MLAGAGFGVLLPDWVRRSRLGLKLTTRSRAAASPGSVTAPAFSLSDLVDFRYELAVGDQTIDPDELAELARLKVPLVRLRGQWVELDDRHLKAALSFLERGGSGTMPAREALLAGLGAADGDLPLTEVDADGWLADLLSGQADARLAPMTTPASFTGRAAAVPGARPCLAVVPRQARSRRRASRRHGPGQVAADARAAAGRAGSRDPGRADAAGLPDVAGGQLAARGREVHPRPVRARASRRWPARGA